MIRRSCVCVAAGLSIFLGVGCSAELKEGEVTGTVTVDGQVPAAGSSITFIPTDGTSPTAGAVLDNGKYSARVPVGKARVEIRVPRPAGGASPAPKEGPGSEGPGGGGGFIEESLPAKYNDATELTIDVQTGKNPKDWPLSTSQ